MGTKALLTLNNHCSRCFIKSAAAGDHSVATFLLEIGTEELPADFARLALDQLEPMVARDLNEQRLNHTGLSCTSTPRRIALIVEGLSRRESYLLSTIV